MNVEELLSQVERLKKDLVAYATSPGFAKRTKALLAAKHAEGPATEGDAIMAVESVIYERDRQAREPLLERFLRTNKNLAPADREMYEQWLARSFLGVFTIRAYDGSRMLLHNLIDDMDYEVYPTVGPAELEPLHRGDFAVARLVPMGQAWTISGNVVKFPAKHRAEIMSMAASLATGNPLLVLANPEIAAESRVLAADQHRVFVKLFGSHIVRGTGAQVVAAYRLFLTTCAAEAASRNPGDAGGERTGEQLAPDSMFAQELFGNDDVAMVHHRMKSASFLQGYSLLEDAHRNPATDPGDPKSEVLRACVQNPGSIPDILEELAARFPGTVDAAYEVAFSRPGFSWERDGEALLRRYKPEEFRTRDLPSIAVLPPWLKDAVHGLAQAPRA